MDTAALRACYARLEAMGVDENFSPAGAQASPAYPALRQNRSAALLPAQKKRAGPHCRVRPLLSDGSRLRLLFALELVAQVLEKALALHVVLVLHALVKGI